MLGLLPAGWSSRCWHGCRHESQRPAHPAARPPGVPGPATAVPGPLPRSALTPFHSSYYVVLSCFSPCNHRRARPPAASRLTDWNPAPTAFNCTPQGPWVRRGTARTPTQHRAPGLAFSTCALLLPSLAPWSPSGPRAPQAQVVLTCPAGPCPVTPSRWPRHQARVHAPPTVYITPGHGPHPTGLLFVHPPQVQWPSPTLNVFPRDFSVSTRARDGSRDTELAHMHKEHTRPLSGPDGERGGGKVKEASGAAKEEPDVDGRPWGQRSFLRRPSRRGV